MWINIYGNRSFRDISQYPVFPWLLTNYEYNTYEELVQNPEIRDFNLPMGMLCIDEKSKKRQEGYIDTYKNMVVELYEQNLVNIRINYEEAIRYGQLYSTHPIRFSKLLDDVGEKDLNRILDLAQLFIGYVKEVEEMDECRVRNVRRKRI